MQWCLLPDTRLFTCISKDPTPMSSLAMHGQALAYPKVVNNIQFIKNLYIRCRKPFTAYKMSAEDTNFSSMISKCSIFCSLTAFKPDKYRALRFFKLVTICIKQGIVSFGIRPMFRICRFKHSWAMWVKQCVFSSWHPNSSSSFRLCTKIKITIRSNSDIGF